MRRVEHNRTKGWQGTAKGLTKMHSDSKFGSKGNAEKAARLWEASVKHCEDDPTIERKGKRYIKKA